MQEFYKQILEICDTIERQLVSLEQEAEAARKSVDNVLSMLRMYSNFALHFEEEE